MPDTDYCFFFKLFDAKDNVLASGFNFVYMLLMFPEKTEAPGK